MKPMKRPNTSKPAPSSARNRPSAVGRGKPGERSSGAGQGRPAVGRGKPSDRPMGGQGRPVVGRGRPSGKPTVGQDRRDARGPERKDSRGPQRGDARGPERRDNKDNRKFGGQERSATQKLVRSDRATVNALGSASTTQRQFHVWGRRPIENYLARLQQDESIDQRSYALHVIADKAGRVPSQLKNIVEPCRAMGIKITLCKSQEEDEWPLSSEEQLNHQRVCLRVPSIPTVSIHDIAQSLPDMIADTPHGCLGLVLDQVQDPRNFGAILRTAAFFGAKFVIFGEDRQAEITPLVVKTSSGGAFSLQLVPTVNINRALEILKKSGVWIVGSSLQASAKHTELPLDRHYVLVVGNESKGMRQEVARHCDYLVKIPGGISAVDSLNVGVATGVLLSTVQTEVMRVPTQLDPLEESFDE